MIAEATLSGFIANRLPKNRLQTTASSIRTGTYMYMGCVEKSTRLIEFSRKSAPSRSGGVFLTTKFNISSPTYRPIRKIAYNYFSYAKCQMCSKLCDCCCITSLNVLSVCLHTHTDINSESEQKCAKTLNEKKCHY